MISREENKTIRFLLFSVCAASVALSHAPAYGAVSKMPPLFPDLGWLDSRLKSKTCEPAKKTGEVEIPIFERPEMPEFERPEFIRPVFKKPAFKTGSDASKVTREKQAKSSKNGPAFGPPKEIERPVFTPPKPPEGFDRIEVPKSEFPSANKK